MRAAGALLCAAITLAGCACPRGVDRSFDLGTDSFAFANELRWEYEFPESGEVVTKKAERVPEYSLRCFPMVRAAREFFYHAEFRPREPKASRDEYRRLVREVLGRNSRCPASPEARIVIPGFADLHGFSAEHGDLLKAECGGALSSFFQRGNWRMVFPVTDSGQKKTAEEWVAKLSRRQLPIAHVYQFPNTALNHALLIYSASEDPAAITFLAYDPNDPVRPATIQFDRVANRFNFERNRYFGGGEVRAYEVYRGAFY